MNNLFAQGVAAEEAGKIGEAEAAYKALLRLEPENASAHVNLGTIYYNKKSFKLSEHHYRAAIYADNKYYLAYFDLANVLDDTDRVDEAIMAYLTALKLNPTHADSHYNLALAYEHISKPQKALRHWRRYATMDQAGCWREHAIQQIRRITKASPLLIERSNPKPRRTKRRAKLILVKH